MSDRRRPAQQPPPRHTQLNLRLSQAELDQFRANAAAASLDGAAFFRKRCLGSIGQGTARRHTELEIELRKLLAEHGRIGHNLSELNHLAQLGEVPAEPEVASAMQSYRDMVGKLMSELGKKP